VDLGQGCEENGYVSLNGNRFLSETSTDISQTTWRDVPEGRP